MKYKVYQAIASKFQALLNCEKSLNREWAERHEDSIKDIVKEYLPSGAGFDTGTHFDGNESNPDKLVFNTAFHHMNDVGMYDGWTYHKVIVTPSLVHGFTLKVTGRDKRRIKEYIAEVFHSYLSEEIDA